MYIYLSIYPSIYLSIYLFSYLSIYLYMLSWTTDFRFPAFPLARRTQAIKERVSNKASRKTNFCTSIMNRNKINVEELLTLEFLIGRLGSQRFWATEMFTSGFRPRLTNFACLMTRSNISNIIILLGLAGCKMIRTNLCASLIVYHFISCVPTYNNNYC